jgi:phytoene dehydrogenase-like protein
MNEKLSQPLLNPSYADIIVVGGGLTGLAAATYAAKSGRAVTLFEKASEPGGRAITKQRSGYSFNLGAHALYYQTEAGEILRELGVSYSGKQPPPLYAIAHGKLHPLPQSPLALLRSTLLDASAKLEFIRVLASAKRANMLALQKVSATQWLDQHVWHPQVRAFLLMLARVTTYTNAPDIQSASLLVEMLRAIPEVLYLDGGWQTLVDGLRQAAQDAGVRIVTGARVAAVEHNERVQGIRLANGEFYPAQSVILAAEPSEASALVDNGNHTALHRWAQEAIPSYVACLDVALRQLPQPSHLGAFGIDRPLYLVVHSASAQLAPQGGALIHTIRYLQPDEHPDPKVIEQELESLLDLVQPGWRQAVVERQFLPHMNATNAIVQAPLGGQPARPGPEVPGIHHLYVAGDWVGPTGQLTTAALASARHAAHLASARTSPQGKSTEREYSYVGE